MCFFHFSISLEHIDYSICTLEFESRRESYYWVLEALEMYRPKVPRHTDAIRAAILIFEYW